MAKLGNNAFGGFAGRLGNVVGYSWKGRWCVRVLPASVRNPRTEAQQRHRSMFAEEVRLAGCMGWALNVGLGAVADEMQMTPQNVFVKANQGAFGYREEAGLEAGGETTGHTSSGETAGHSNLVVDWKGLIVSAGPVAPVALGVPALTDEGVLTVEFEKNPLHMRADNFDQVHLYVYCPALRDGYLAAPVYRKERKVSVVLPELFAGQDMHLYAFVTDEQGRASESCYAAVEVGVIGENGVAGMMEVMGDDGSGVGGGDEGDSMWLHGDFASLRSSALAHSSTAASGGPPPLT